MDRRCFLKVLAGFGIAIAVPEIVFTNKYSFDKNRSYGSYVRIPYGATNNDIKKMLVTLDRGFMSIIPPEYRDKIQYILHMPTDTDDPFRREGTIGWKYSPRHSKNNSKHEILNVA